jgi:hypothetical protein
VDGEGAGAVGEGVALGAELRVPSRRPKATSNRVAAGQRPDARSSLPWTYRPARFSGSCSDVISGRTLGDYRQQREQRARLSLRNDCRMLRKLAFCQMSSHPWTASNCRSIIDDPTPGRHR